MKKLNELTAEEVKALLKVNKFLQNAAEEQANNDYDYLIGEIVEPFRTIAGIDYSISGYYDYFTVKECAYKDFLEACADHPEAYIFTDEEKALITRAAAKAGFYYDVLYGYEDMSDYNLTRLETWIEKAVNVAREAILRTCGEQDAYRFTDEAQEEAALVFCDMNGEQYETDGKYIFETEVRKYA